MDFIKKHYEKIVLSLVLIGLVVAVGWLPIAISQEKQRLAADVNPVGPPAELEPVDLTRHRELLARLSRPDPVVLTGEHNLFNPVIWQRRPDGSLRKVLPGDVGPGAVEVTAIHPLHLVMDFETTTTTTTTGSGYRVRVTREGAPTSRDRNAKPKYARLNQTNSITYWTQPRTNSTEFSFVVREVRGEEEDPEALVVELLEREEQVVIPRGQEFRRIEGYAADLRYAPEEKTWRDQRVGDALVFDNDTNNIVDITVDEVVLSARSNNKQTTLKLDSAQVQE